MFSPRQQSERYADFCSLFNRVIRLFSGVERDTHVIAKSTNATQGKKRIHWRVVEEGREQGTGCSDERFCSFVDESQRQQCNVAVKNERDARLDPHYSPLYSVFTKRAYYYVSSLALGCLPPWIRFQERVNDEKMILSYKDARYPVPPLFFSFFFLSASS